MSERCAFIRASVLYDVEAGERIQWDWGKMQLTTASRAGIRHVAAKMEGR